MLKIFYLSERLGEEIFNRTIKLFEVGYHRFKYDGDECIIFKSEDQDAVSNYLGISMDSSEDLKEYIENFNGGGYLQVTRHVQIGQSECIEIMQENFEKYEDRIWQAENYRDEILQIIQEQMYKAFLDVIKHGFETINNGNFKWN